MFFETDKDKGIARLACCLFEQTYEYVFLIDVQENRFATCNFWRDDEGYKNSYSEEEDADRWFADFFGNYRVMDARVMPAMAFRVPVMVQRLEREDRVGSSFPVCEGGALRHKRVEYRYFDTQKRMICLTVQDITAILEEERNKDIARFDEDMLMENEDFETRIAHDNYFASDSEFDGRKVLIAGMEERIQKVADLLREFKVQAELFVDGRAAVKHLSHSKVGEYDIVFLDENLPSMDGIEITRQLRRCKRRDLSDMTIVIISDAGMREARIGALEAGADYHICYPVEKAMLVEMLLGEMDNPTPKKAFELKGFKVIK